MTGQTLLDIFLPPEGMIGHSAALIAMTGAEDLLEEAVLRFTGLRPRQRAELGNVLVYLMLDGHSSLTREAVFPPGRIPGLHEFQPRIVDPRSLLHAKLALLAFAPNRAGVPAHLRLAVLTANFTYTSARHQLELVWYVDLPLDSNARAGDRADIAAAGVFVEQLLERRFYRDEQELPMKNRKLTARLDALLKAATSIAPAKRKPRFMHSLDHSLYDQIRERFRRGIRKPKNFLLCGSGFYEEPSTKARKPAVFGKLEGLGVFTKDVRRVALVEPEEAGAVAAWAKAGETDGWEVMRASDALGKNRQLHAKFVYAGRSRGGALTEGWLYLGSGNLSRRGILSHDGMEDGNVETGVVFAVEGPLNHEAVEHRLFWSNHTQAIRDDEWSIGHGGDLPDALPILRAPPILSAMIEIAPVRRLRLFWREDAPNDAQVSIQWIGGNWLNVKRGDAVSLFEESPTALQVRDGSQSWVVPIVDAAGRVGWEPLRFDTYADALAALLDFPIRPAEANDDSVTDESYPGGTWSAGTRAVEQEKSYALHAAAELIEKVAALQLALPTSLLDDWLDHLERMFQSSFPEHLVTTWRTHQLDVFAHLRESDLGPPQLTDVQRVRYVAILDAAASSWGLR